MGLFNKKQMDVLTEKTERLESLTKKADSAVSIVKSTINGLKNTNAEIEQTTREIDEYCANLTAVRDQLNENYRHNTAVIANFSKLLDVDEE